MSLWVVQTTDLPTPIHRARLSSRTMLMLVCDHSIWSVNLGCLGHIYYHHHHSSFYVWRSCIWSVSCICMVVGSHYFRSVNKMWDCSWGVWSSDFQPTVGKIYTDSTNTRGSTGRCSGGLFLTVLVGHVILSRCWAPDMQVNVGKAHSMFSVWNSWLETRCAWELVLSR